MNVMLINCTSNGEDLAGRAAAMCTQSANWEKSLKHSLESGHESVIEHVTFTFLIEGVSRALLAQLTRHRIGVSFSVLSQRYVDMGEMPMVIPKSIREDKELLNEFGIAMDAVKTFYRKAVERGIPKEDARYCTPQACKTSMIMTMNARELKHFFELRCCNRAQWEIRELADQMLLLCKEKCPMIFRNAGPGCVSGYCREKKPCAHPRCNERPFNEF